MTNRMLKFAFIGLFILMLASCGDAPAVSSEDRINTSVAQTVAAAQPPDVQLPTQGVVTAPTDSPPAVGEQPTLTPIPLSTLALPTATFTASPTPDTCYQAKFIDDVTIPDGTKISPNANFTKTWRIQNSGTCTWNTGYAVVFDGGHTTGAPASTPLPTSVPPGGTTDVSVVITAPAVNGDYTWKFKLRSDTGRVFGFGTGFAYPMTAEIKVEPVILLPLPPGGLEIIPFESMKYDFATNYCSASWASIFGPLDCPGDTSDSQGFVKRDDDPKLQDGKVYSGKAIFTHPAFASDGVIRGNFPAILIDDGYRFRAVIGCTYNKSNCNVRFTISYKAGGDPWEQLGTWVVDYNDDPIKLDIDLSFLDGKNVQFGLVVAANGSEEQDWAHWVKPRIVKETIS